jgi:hypothetical protein
MIMKTPLAAPRFRRSLQLLSRAHSENSRNSSRSFTSPEGANEPSPGAEALGNLAPKMPKPRRWRHVLAHRLSSGISTHPPDDSADRSNASAPAGTACCSPPRKRWESVRKKPSPGRGGTSQKQISGRTLCHACGEARDIRPRRSSCGGAFPGCEHIAQLVRGSTRLPRKLRSLPATRNRSGVHSSIWMNWF